MLPYARISVKLSNINHLAHLVKTSRSPFLSARVRPGFIAALLGAGALTGGALSAAEMGPARRWEMYAPRDWMRPVGPGYPDGPPKPGRPARPQGENILSRALQGLGSTRETGRNLGFQESFDAGSAGSNRTGIYQDAKAIMARGRSSDILRAAYRDRAFQAGETARTGSGYRPMGVVSDLLSLPAEARRDSKDNRQFAEDRGPLGMTSDILRWMRWRGA